MVHGTVPVVEYHREPDGDIGWVDNQYLLSRFMEYLNGNLAREVNRLHGRTGPVWERRYQAIVVTEEEQAQVDRLKYLLSQSVKENLVAKVKQMLSSR